ncbi:FHA domain-containing protein [Arenibaculum pallidiluteum]|uniref:FHA domain-containing protein n=1 Tax=Arenibaculum pallidiluteum TaxID=2812559 RepID=UPI001A95E3A3|nr:FHA domain-containing protein [Arenibaculum pallidiluteum]
MLDGKDARQLLEGGWCLRSDRGAAIPIRLVIGDTELARAHLGVVVGRHPALCDRTIDEITVSRRHCRFSTREERLYVEDLNSLNGTRLDEAELAPFDPTPVRAGQTLSLGRLVLAIGRLDGEGRDG